MPEPAPDAPPLRPRSRAELFTAFTWLALQGFGGVLAVVQRELVEKRRWLTRDQFVEDWAVAQIMPGPNVVNLALMIGGRHFGLPGALSALAGMLLAPLALLLLLAVLYSQFAMLPQAQAALRGMGAVAAGLITATGLKLVAALRSNVMGLGVCMGFAACTFVAIALLRWPLAWVLLGLGTLASAWAWRQLGRTGG
ncbi:chromate transporter [Hydrogenophaga borbori]|uniref:chromate transporter n=1 Tax=Hydrogenophaga borbori TaxID=2294117 RepID=UPI00301BC2A7